MTDTNPYDFLSEGEAPSLNGSSQETFSAPQAVAEREIETTIEGDRDFSDSPYSALDADEPTNGVHSDLTTHAPQGAVPREDSLAALAAQEAHRVAHDSNGFTDEMAIESHTNGRADYESSYDHLSDSEAITAYESAPELAPLSDGGEPPKPPSDSERAILQPQEPIGPNERPHDDEMDIWSHLGELRSRMLKAILAVVVTSSLAWNFVGPIQEFLLAPVQNILTAHGIKDNSKNHSNWEITVTDPMQAFTTYFQLAVVAGIIAAAPIVLWQMWRFIEPALTHNEKRYSTLLVPFSTLLFFLGCALGYYTSPLFFNFFLAFVPPGVTVLWTYTSVVTLLGKMLLVFGVCFQVPVVTIFLNKTGVVSRNVLIEYWRHVVVVIFIVVAILTPTWDPITMTICALPPCILYALSIWLIKWL